jgi:hypothetical protein
MIKVVNSAFEEIEWNQLDEKKLPGESWHDAILRWAGVGTEEQS